MAANAETEDLLTVEERAWLAEHPVIRMAPTPDFRPAGWFDDRGNYLGMTSDFMDELEHLLGIDRHFRWFERRNAGFS